MKKYKNVGASVRHPFSYVFYHQLPDVSRVNCRNIRRDFRGINLPHRFRSIG